MKIALFLYFLTLHADQLHIKLGEFTLRLNNLIALSFFVFYFCAIHRRLLKIDKELCIALFALGCSILLSCVFSIYKLRCVFFLLWYSFTILMYVLFPYVLMKYESTENILSIYMLSFIVVGVYAALQLVFSLVGYHDPFASQWIKQDIVRPNAWAYEPSFYALYMTPFIVMVNYHFLAYPRVPFFFIKHLSFIKVLLLNFFYLICVTSSAVFALGVFCFTLIFFPSLYRRLLQYGALTIGIFCVIGCCFPFLFQVFFFKFFFHNPLELDSFTERWEGIKNAWTLFLHNPFFGVGLGGIPSTLYDAYLTGDNRFSFFFTSHTLTDTDFPLKLIEPMNVTTELLASLGLIGTLCVVHLLSVFFRRAKQAVKSPNSWELHLVLSVIVMLIVMQINQGLLRTYIWTHFSLAFAYLEKRKFSIAPDIKLTLSGSDIQSSKLRQYGEISS